MVALPTLTTEMVIIMVIVVFAVLLFATELLRVDVAAILIINLLGLLIFVPDFIAAPGCTTDISDCLCNAVCLSFSFFHHRSSSR